MAEQPRGNAEDFGFSDIPEDMGSVPPSMDSPPMDAPPMAGPPMGSGPMEPPPMGAPPVDRPPASSDNFSANPTVERIEEIAEAIIDEKWNDLVKTINKIIEWKERTEGVILRIQTEFQNLRKDYDNLTRGVLGKIGEYNQNIANIGVEIKAMEKVFEKVLPLFTENVHTLDRVTKDLKNHHSNLKGNV